MTDMQAPVLMGLGEFKAGEKLIGFGPDGEIFECVADRDLQGPCFVINGRKIHPYPCTRFILAPVTPKHAEIWEEYLLNDGVFSSSHFSLGPRNKDGSSLNQSHTECLAAAAFILNELDLYDDEMRKRIEGAL